MPKKLPSSRLENLFSKLEEREVPSPDVKPAYLPSWTWEVNGDSEYEVCSPEVIEGLGIQPIEWIGKPLFTFAIAPSSALDLQEKLEMEVYPVELVAEFNNRQGNLVQVRMTIFQRFGEHGQPDGWRGFNQLLSTFPAMVPPRQANSRILTRQNYTEIPVKPGQKSTKPEELNGFSDISLHSTEKPWSEAARTSLVSGKPATHSDPDGKTAILAVPFQVGDQAKGVIEIIDEDARRRWSEDDLLLTQDVAHQLALALENAQLYAAVQQELSDRVRAEQETNKRNQELRLLNQVGQQFSKLTSRQELLNLVQKSIGEIVDHRNLTIALLNPLNRTLSFPIHTINGVAESLPDRPAGNEAIDFILNQKTTLLLTRKVKQGLRDRGVTLPDPVPASLLGIPMLAGDRPVGAILILDFEREDAFSKVDAELLSTIAAQATTALENSNLFQEITNALQTLEMRERYQGNVAKSVATLTQFGTLALSDVLNTLAMAAGCNRTYYAAISQDGAGTFWRCLSEWNNPNLSTRQLIASAQHLPTATFPHWIIELRGKGWISGSAKEMTSPEREFMLAQGIDSVLWIAVPGKNQIPNVLAFEQHGEIRQWQPDEISILRLAADALSNTVIREDLLEQLQSSLDETESLYNASHRLALANDLNEMVTAIAMDMHIPAINRGILVLFEPDPQGSIHTIRVAATWHSGSGANPPTVGWEFPRGAYERIFFTQAPSFIDDVYDPQIDPGLRDIMVDQHVSSLAILPLWAGKRQIGVLLLASEMKHRFTSRETRSYPPLVDQMAITIENQRLFRQTQAALAETGVLYQISNGIAQADNPEALINLAASQMLPVQSDRAALFITNRARDGSITDFEVVGYFDKRQEPTCLGLKISSSELPYFISLMQTVAFSDIAQSEMDDVSQNTFRSHGVTAICIVPLQTAGETIGFLTTSSRTVTNFNPEDIRVIEIASGGFAVAIERYRLLNEAQRRALELQTAAEIARDSTSTLAFDRLLERIVNSLKARFHFYHVSVFLLDETGNFAVIRESSGEAGQAMKQRGHKLSVGSRSVVGMATASGETQALPDVSLSSIYYPNPLLPDTRGEIGIPLKSGDKVIGALDIQYDTVNAFTPGDISVLQILADQIAVAIQNARAYELSQKAYQEMKEVDRVKSQFLANMSHELRTPLNSIIGFSRVILKGIDGPINETQKQDLSAIYNSGQHLLTLINNILDLSKIEAGKMELQMTDLNISDIVNSVMSTAVGLVKDKPIRLQQDIPSDLPMVRADQTRVRQILLNFVSNAAKFTEEGAISVAALPVVGPKGKKEVMVTISDTGTGIALEDQGKLFQPFSQVDDSPTRKTGGTGLGLSICRSMVEMHGGRIGLLNSEPGKGSTFFFTLQVSQPEIHEDFNLQESNVILAIDDDLQVVNLYQRYLKPQGYHVIPLTDPKQAVVRAKEIKPYAITLDIMMPEMDGWQVLRKLKNDSETRNIPIVICSILEDEEKGFSLGAADYLVKPFLQEDLTNTINRLNRDGSIRTILVIDDDAGDQRLVKKMLEESGQFQVILADGGKEGLEKLHASLPDAVILDLFMPDLDGFSVLGNLRSEPQFKELPVIVLTGADLSPQQQYQMAQFGQQMLTKGLLREKELLNTLEIALRKIKSYQSNQA